MTDRVIVWAGQIPLETDVLRSNKFAMTGIAKLAAAVLGTSATVVNGLAAVPTAPATLTVNVNPGEIYSLVSMDATAYSSVAADTTHQIMKSGILLDAVNLSCPAPGTAGQSINYLIEAIYQDSDTDLTTLPYYNASNPSSAWSGPNNSGTPQATTRKGTVALVAKAGAAATTGSQTTPTPDAGYTGLWVVTVANGQSTITSGNITQYSGAPILPSSLLASIQNGNLSYAVATGTANAHTIALTPTLTSRVDGMMVRYKAPAANTGAVTLADGVGTATVLGANHSALQGGEYITNGDAVVIWNSSISGGSYILVECTGGAIQVAPATQSNHAPQMSQVAGVVGSVRNLVMNVTAASFTATMTADEIVAETALGGIRYCLSSFSKTINLSTTGAGGMDTGSPPATGYLAIYAIYNPTTQTTALLAQNASVLRGNVYSGANMPAGYTASALVSVWPTDASGHFIVASQLDREIYFPEVSAFTTSSAVPTFTATGINAIVPVNAKTFGGTGASTNNTASDGVTWSIAGSSSGVGVVRASGNAPVAGAGVTAPYSDVPLPTAQTAYYTSIVVGGGVATFSFTISKYTF